MYPSKSMYEYMSEMNRLFPRTSDNDIFQSPNTPSTSSYPSPYNQTTINQSSSSADSTSPDAFPDMPIRPDNFRLSEYETPFSVRRQRPIVGRKIFDTPQPVSEPTPKHLDQDEFPRTIWQDEFSRKPNLFMEQKHYELFPTENKGFELQNLVKTAPSNTVVSPPNYSPRMPNVSPNSAKLRLPTPMFNFATSSRYQEANKMCTFCRKNGETPLVYMTHTVKEKIGGRNVVTCPILRSHVCSTCGASGDDAHTITYCPVLRSSNNGQPLQSTTITLKNTRIKSNGRRRY